MTTRFYYLPITHHASEKPTAVAALQLREVITSWATNLTRSDATLELKARSTYARSTYARRASYVASTVASEIVE